jgi:C-terminal peptidase prc
VLKRVVLRYLGLLFFVFTSSFIHFYRPFGNAVASAPEPLSCRAAFDIGVWSWKKAPTQSPQSLSDSGFASRVVIRFAELADQNRLLFTQSEVDDLKRRSLPMWNEFVQKKSCRSFEQWLSVTYDRALQRFLQALRAESLESFVPAKLPRIAEEEMAHPRYQHFPKDEKERLQRIHRFAQSIAGTVNRAQLAAFSQNRRALMLYAMENALLESETPKAVPLLARAFLSTLDPFSDFFTKEEFADFYRDLSGGTSGVGVRLRDVPAGLLVLGVVKESPAGASHKIFEGDIIVRVDGKPLSEMAPKLRRQTMEGAELSKVVLTLAPRMGKPQRDVVIVRKAFAFEDARVTSHLVRTTNKRVGVISVPSFYGRGEKGESGERSSAEDVELALRRLLESKPQAIVLDLRGNPGGYLEESVTMAGFFLGNKPVVAVVEPTAQRLLHDYRSAPLYSGPLVVLVDDQSASAAEVLAGALKDYQRAVILGGARTYGKGSVQRLFHLDSGVVQLAAKDSEGVLKLTTSFFYSPMGQSPAGAGIVPHIALRDPKERKAQPSIDERPKQSQTAPPQRPFVDAAVLSEIRLKEATMQSRIEALKASSEVRDEDVRRVFQKEVARALGPESESGPLAESVAIASELVELESLAKANDSSRIREAKKTSKATGPMVLYK